MREPRDFRPQQLYGVTQRGNQGQWVYRDDQDFQEGLGLMRKYAARYGVNIHGWCLMHNHGHWIFEASSEDSISKCDARRAGLLAPLTVVGRRLRKMFSPYHRSGPVNWTPRFDAVFLDGAGFREFLRYVENNPVRAHLKKTATDWAWSSARAHVAGERGRCTHSPRRNPC